MGILGRMAEAAIRLDNSKRVFTDANEYDVHMERLRIRNEQEYEMPVKLKRCNVKTFNFKGMKCFELKRKGSRSNRIVLYLHGGAYINRLTPFHWWFLNSIAKKTGAAIIVPIYHLAPVHTADESFGVIEKLYDEIRRINCLSKVTIMGDSAGGGFGLAMSQQLRDAGKKLPDEIILVSPWVDITMQNEEMKPLEEIDVLLGIDGLRRAGEMWAGAWSTTDSRVSPIYGNFKGLSPITLFVGTHEIFLPEERRLKAKVEQEKVSLCYNECDGMGHCYPVMPLPEGKSARKLICQTICR